MEGAHDPNPRRRRSEPVTATLGSTRNVLLAVGDAGLWAVWSTVCGYAAHRLSAETLARDGLLRLRAFFKRRAWSRGWDEEPHAQSGN